MKTRLDTNLVLAEKTVAVHNFIDAVAIEKYLTGADSRNEKPVATKVAMDVEKKAMFCILVGILVRKGYVP